jgi:hypothetical protein
MNKKWLTVPLTALLLLVGCGKSNNNANQTATSSDNGSTATNQTAPQQPAPAPAPPPPPPKPFQVAAGTSLPVILSTTISSKVNKPGDTFEAALASPVMSKGEVAIPKGSVVRGSVVDVKKQGTFKGEADLAIRLTSITVRGKEYPISTASYGASQKGKGKRTAVVTGGGAALGALVGGLAGGGKGAAIGAGVGGGGGLAASGLTGAKNVELPAETRIVFTLADGITVDR